MSEPDRDIAFDATDMAVVGQTKIVAFDAVVAHLAALHPNTPVTEIDDIVRAEHDAVTGGRPIAVPTTVLDGVEERLTPPTQ